MTAVTSRRRMSARRLPRCLAAASVVALAALLALGCAGNDGRRSILLYNGQHPELTDALVSAFERQTGIDVRVRTNDGIVLADQLLQEGSHSSADIYLTENSPELVMLDQNGLLGKLGRSTLSETPSRYRTSSGHWAAVALRVSALAYDPQLVGRSQLPTHVLALAEPGWKGKIAIAPTDSDFAPLVDAVIARYGKAEAARWLDGLKRNAKLYESDEAVVAAVNRGDVATGVINNYYWFRLRLEIGQKAMRSAIYYFPGQDVENVSGAAVLASSAHPRDAEAFVRFLSSAAAQRIIAAGDDYEYPAKPGIAPNAALPALSSIAPATLGPDELGNDQEAARLIRESGLA
jgi:iron(III) transport system substrate-binding protein